MLQLIERILDIIVFYIGIKAKTKYLEILERYALEFNHTLNTTTFYTIRLSKFQQDQFIGVRMNDNDNDGYPDWFEWSNPAGYSDYSDPKNPDLVPFQFNESGDEIIYIAQDGLGPDSFSSGWYYGASPGNYNWAAADEI